MVRAVTRAVLALALALAACGGASGETVRFQIFGDAAEIAAYRVLIEAFEARAPDVRVELVAAPSQDDHGAKLATAFAGGSPPDLFLVNYRRFGQFAAKGVLEPLGARLGGTLREADFYAEPLDAFRFDGTLLCLPQNASTQVVYWNETLFRDAGIEPPSPRWTWDDFLRTAEALTRDTDADGRPDVYGLGVEPDLVHLGPFVWQAGGEVVDDTARPTTTTLVEPAAIRAVTFFVELRREHLVAPSQQEAESEDLESRFAAGRVAMLIDSRRVTAALRLVPALDWDVAPLPRDRRAATMLHADAYCMARSSPRKDAAFRFVEFALGPEGAAIVARSGRTVPSLRAVAESEAFLDPALEPESARVWLDQIPLVRRFPNIETWNEIETRSDPIVEEWYYGTEPPEALGLEIIAETLELFET